MHRSGMLEGDKNYSRQDLFKRSGSRRTEGWSTKRTTNTYKREDQLTLRMVRHTDADSGLGRKETWWTCKHCRSNTSDNM
eukprot:9949028-Heterocapsa_arctica.AAC.1